MEIIEVLGWKCKRCEYKWVPRKDIVPCVCPKCKSPYWNRERRKKE